MASTFAAIPEFQVDALMGNLTPGAAWRLPEAVRTRSPAPCKNDLLCIQDMMPRGGRKRSQTPLLVGDEIGGEADDRERIAFGIEEPRSPEWG
jgi:hypothetical protein